MSTENKDFRVKNGLSVAGGGTFGAPVTIGEPVNADHAATKNYVDSIPQIPGPQGPAGSYIASETPPENPENNTAWFDTTTGATFMFYDGFWIETTGAVGPTGPTGPAGTTPSLDGYAELSGAFFNGDVVIESSNQYSRIGVKSSHANGYGILSYSKPGGNGFDIAYDNANDNLAINRFVGGNYNSTILGISADGSMFLPSGTSIGGVSSTEIGYLDGVTSSIQTQLDAKASTSSPTFTNPTLSINSSYNSLVTDYLMSYFISASGSNRTMSFGSWTVMLNSTSLVAGDKVLLFSNSGVASTSEPVTVVSFDLNNSQVVLTSTNPAVLTQLEAQDIVGGQAYKVIDQSLSITPQNLLRLSNLLNAPKIPANNSILSVGRYFVPSSIDPFTLTLPASPELGDEIQIFDSGNYAGTQNITINRNGKNINGVADNALLDVNGVAATFVYTGSTYGWRMG